MVQISWRALLLGGLVLLPTAAVAQGLPTPKDASLYIISPKDGATVSGPFLVYIWFARDGYQPCG
jgi:hypothetical protein